MEDVREKDGTTPSTGGLKTRLDNLERKIALGELKKETEAKQQFWKFPFSWKAKLNRALRIKDNRILVLYLNIKGEIEEPVILPYRDNMVLYKNKVYEFDPRAIITINYKNKNLKALFIREIDRRPISNLDWAEVRQRGDATDSDELLIKAAASLQLSRQDKKLLSRISWWWIILGIILIIKVFSSLL